MTPHPFSIKLDQTSVVPLNEQLTKALQEEIRHRLQPGDRLPASRILAKCLGISRNTVTAAYRDLRSSRTLRTRATGALRCAVPCSDRRTAGGCRTRLRQPAGEKMDSDCCAHL